MQRWRWHPICGLLQKSLKVFVTMKNFWAFSLDTWNLWKIQSVLLFWVTGLFPNIHLLKHLNSDGFIVDVNHHHPFRPFYSVPVALSCVLKWNCAPPWWSLIRVKFGGMVIFQELDGQLDWGFFISINSSFMSILETSYIYIYTLVMVSSHCHCCPPSRLVISS